ncbi:Tpr-related protein family member, putative [Theileria annulata]|uniref:Tpr-related protein family member, putative n=1 Tax=Theileria annulata TaxID=5874 RepID=Q4UHW7_THEAN|nr:Tpr-related protein family member, putative [Theileria annulata]CAI73322.1 Tpr-related protein family member, putative [Theileria annulata]|eukprot:XP_953999.1 Tpr-related protein family member, putative [Theileria annulata]
MTVQTEKKYEQDHGFSTGDLQTAAYMFAGLAMMLNIRLSYSAAPFALLRFKLPENLFSVFVRTTSSALELWCLPSMTIGNIMEQVYINYFRDKDAGKKDSDVSDGTKVSKWYWIVIPSIITNWLNFLTFVILLIIYVTGGDQGHLTCYYWIMAISGFVFGINMVLVYAVDYRYLAFYMAGENSFPMVTSLILYFATSIFGNRRKYNSDYLVVLIDISISIAIALVASVLWTIAFWQYRAPKASRDSPNKEVTSPVLLVLVGMGLVYSIYPGIAPGMIVPFHLIDKIEMVLLILTTFPPLIFAFTTKYAPNWSPKTKFVFHSPSKMGFGGWKQYQLHVDKTYAQGECDENEPTVYGWLWHFFDILAPLQIILAVIFIYSIHYRDSNISRSIVNQPKMSTFLTIIFYMCHEIMLATGFPGLVCNNGVTWVLLPTQWVGALLMVFLAFYSIGYITEYKRHDPSEWPTDGMTWWNSVCYWLKMASKITNKNFKQLFTTDLRRLTIYYK